MWTLRARALAGSVALTACGAGSTPSAAQPTIAAPSASLACPAAASQLIERDNSFSPRSQQVAVGTKVVVTNCGQSAHTWTSPAAGFDSGTIEPTKSFSFTFTTAGTFSFVCQIHPGMAGSITVA